MRELRVEDALMYLDQVKMEFGDRPQIYNEFLHIMKTFKSQEIDTPGVILRVTQLFQGNKALVLGFNTFLPDGFKIEIPDHGTGTVYYRTPNSHLTPIHAIAMARRGDSQFDPQLAGPPQQQRSPHMNPSQPPANVPGGNYGLQQQGPMMGAQPPGAGQPNAQQPPQGQMPGGPGPNVEHMPMGVQNGFMQENAQGEAGGFKPPKKSPHQHVSPHHNMQQPPHQQHRPIHMGMPNLGQPPQGGGQEGIEQDMQRGLPPLHPQTQQGGMPPRQQHMQVGGNGSSEPQMQGSLDTASVGPGNIAQNQQPQQPQQQPQQQQQPQNGSPATVPAVPVEFDHAINYVTTIKRTFANDPDTYKKFLEILHTYQKEQRGIKEVLDEVSVLFADHPVLLKDFTYFLPDAVQQQAKLQLAHAVRQAESRRAALNSKQAIESQARQQRPHAVTTPQQPQQDHEQQQEQQQPPPPPKQQPPQPQQEQNQQQSQQQDASQEWNSTQPRKPFGVKQGRSENRERDICRSAIYGVVSFDPVRPPRKNELTPAQAAAKYGRPRSIPEAIIQPTTKEASFFERAKNHLMQKELAPDKAPGTRRHTPHAEFLKCLHLYGAGILSKDELILLLRSLFMQGHAPKSGANASGGITYHHIADAANKLIKEFEQLLVARGPYARQQSALKDKSKYGAITCKEWDSTLSDDVTPSYRSYPSDYPYEDFFTHSGQTEADASVLNTSVVCVRNENRNGKNSKIRALDILEEYDGVRMRRNVYEEALAKVEDERFEVDLAIETNAAAMRQVEPLAEEITVLKENEEKEGQPIGRLHYEFRPKSLTCNHLGAIARLYGEQGDEVINHLMRNPISVLPIVFKRLKEKDLEWRKVRVELSKHWRSVCDSNYEASLDVTSHFNRREIEKSINQEMLIEECKRAFTFARKPKEMHKATEILAPTFNTSYPDPEMLLFHSNVSLKASEDMPYKDVYECVALQILNSAAKTNADREKSSRLWTEFILPWFGLPTHWFLKELRDKARSEKSSCIVKYAPGQKVKTVFGNGRILAFNEGTSASAPHYDVDLPFGRGHIRPSSIVHHNPTEVQYVRENGFMELVQNCDEPMNGETNKKLPASTKVVFGTEKTYVFLRLYCALLALFDSAKKTMESSGDIMEIDERTPDRYRAYISNLKDYINEDIPSSKSFRAYELRCRSLTREKCYELSAIPRLIEKCADALVKVAKEDKLLGLFDFYQLQTMDPVLQRSQSLSLTSDASYRIQYRKTDQTIQFCYLPAEKEMLTFPRNSNGSNTLNMERSRLSEGNILGEGNFSKNEEKSKGEFTEEGASADTFKNDEPDSKRARLSP